MHTNKQQMLNDAPSVLNRPDLPWQVGVQGDSIIATWKWMDAMFFAPGEVNNAVQQYAFIVTLKDNGKWSEQDKSEKTTSNVNFKNGQLSFGGSKSSFSGKQSGKSVQIGLGRNNQTGEEGIVGFKYDTSQVKEWVRGWLTQNGWKKAGLFG